MAKDQDMLIRCKGHSSMGVVMDQDPGRHGVNGYRMTRDTHHIARTVSGIGFKTLQADLKWLSGESYRLTWKWVACCDARVPDN